MGYSLSEIYEKGIELMDKKGSDFVQLPEFLRVYKTSTYDFIGERIPVIEKTQQIINDLRPLMKTDVRTVIDDPDDVYAKLATIPNEVHYLFKANAKFENGTTGRRPVLLRHGNIDVYMSDPNNRPTPEYPIILQFMDYVKILTGYDEKATACYMTYLKEPTFATLQTPDVDCVNLSMVAQEDILAKTVTSLLGTRADERYQIKKNEEMSYREGRI